MNKIYRNLESSWKKEACLLQLTWEMSHIIPSIHPGFAIGTKEVNHTKKFNEATNTPKAHAQTLLNGKAMAYTCIDILWTDGALEEVKKTFAERKPTSQEPGPRD